MITLENIKKEAKKLLASANTLDELEEARVKILGRKGFLTIFLGTLKDLTLAKRRKIGPEAQSLKKEIEQKIEEKVKKLKEDKHKKASEEKIDVTRPGFKPVGGALHPLTLVEREIVKIFESMGFSVAEGPDIETEYYNFDALNIPVDHPARDLWDTFWLRSKSKKRFLLRTHTSPVQVRYMEKNRPPLKIVSPGSVFRYEAIDATHNIQFAQLEGLLVDKKVSVANFKAVIEDFIGKFFSAKGGPASGGGKRKIKFRLRPSYFPFVEPGFEVDMLHKGKWLEIMGAGMVHPNVFKNAGINPKDWQGFAFGMGIDRLAMIKYEIDDIRLFYQNDIRFLRQF